MVKQAKWVDAVLAQNPCSEAREWFTSAKVRNLTPAKAWATCPRADWMLWLAGRVGVDRRKLVLAACDCAETSLKHVPKDEKRPAEAIRVARAWANDEPGVTLQDVRNAYAAAYAAYAAYAAAAHAAAAADAADAADAAAYAAYAAAHAAYAAYAAQDADAAAAYAAYAAYAAAAHAAAAAAAARTKALESMAKLVRKHVKVSDVMKALEFAGREAA